MQPTPTVARKLHEFRFRQARAGVRYIVGNDFATSATTRMWKHIPARRGQFSIRLRQSHRARSAPAFIANNGR